MKLLFPAVVCLSSIILFSCSGQTDTKSGTNAKVAKAFAEEFKGKSLKEISDAFKEKSDQIEGLFKVMDTRLEIIPGKDKDQSSDEGVIYGEGYTVTPPKFIESALKTRTSNYIFLQAISPEGSVITTSLQKDYKPASFLDPSKRNGASLIQSEVAVKNVYLHDHSTLKDKIGLPDEEGQTMLSSKKPIDSLNAQVKYTYVTKVEKIILDEKDVKKNIGDGKIELKKLGNGSATFLYNGPAGRILSVAGMDTKGRLIEQNSSSNYSIPSAAKRKYLEELNDLLKSTVKNIDAGKYKTVNELIADFTKKIPQEINTEDAAVKNTLLSSYHFYQDISRVVIYYATESKTFEQQVTLKNEDVISSGFLLAKGEKDTGYGIMGADGNWLVKPAYKELYAVNSYYYRTCEDYNEGNCEYFRFDPDSKKMIPFEKSNLKGNIITFSTGKDHVRFQKVNTNSSEVYPVGLLDNKGNVILKPLYDVIFTAGNYFIAVQDNVKTGFDEYGLYTKAGKLVLPASRQVIGHDGNFIFLEQPGNPNLDYKKYKLLDDRTGNSFLPAGVFALQTDWVSDIMLVTNGKSKYIIDRQKNKKADLSAYVTIKPFVGQYANVKNKAGYWGVIDKNGKEIVKCSFTEISTIYNNICLVSDAGPDQKQRYGLFNVVTGYMIVPLMTREDNFASVHGEGADVTYYIGGAKYDASGKKIKE